MYSRLPTITTCAALLFLLLAVSGCEAMIAGNNAMNSCRIADTGPGYGPSGVAMCAAAANYGDGSSSYSNEFAAATIKQLDEEGDWYHCDTIEKYSECNEAMVKNAMSCLGQKTTGRCPKDGQFAYCIDYDSQYPSIHFWYATGRTPKTAEAVTQTFEIYSESNDLCTFVSETPAPSDDTIIKEARGY